MRHVVTVWLLGAVMGLSACVSLGESSLTASSAASSAPEIEFRSPLQVKEQLEQLGVFGDCVIGDVRVDVRGNPTEVACFVLRFEDMTSNTSAYSADRRSVFVWVYKPGQYSQELVCRDFDWYGDDHFAVSDKRSFLAMATSGLRDGDGEWPKEVWPEDVQRALGGEVMVYTEFCAGG